jgi:ribosome maturation factor RimP
LTEACRKAVTFFDRSRHHRRFKVIITLDDDNGVVLQDCIDISRAIDLSLDRKQDYSRRLQQGFTIKEDQTVQENIEP